MQRVAAALTALLLAGCSAPETPSPSPVSATSSEIADASPSPTPTTPSPTETTSAEPVPDPQLPTGPADTSTGGLDESVLPVPEERLAADSATEAVTRAAKDSLQLPMAIATKRTADFLTSLFEAAEASGWLVPSDAPEMGGRAWAFDVKPNEVRSADALDVSYWLRYDGTNRQTFVTQTITR